MHNRNALHVKLFQVSGPRHVILRTQKMLAAELGMSQFTLNRIMSEMVDDRRIKIIGKGRSASKRYVVYDPREWCEARHDFAGAEFARSILDPSEKASTLRRHASEGGAGKDERGEEPSPSDAEDEDIPVPLLLGEASAVSDPGQ